MYTLLVTGDVPGAATYFNPLLQQTIIPCTSGTRPSSPPDGMHVFETDTDILRAYSNGSWAPVMQIGAGSHTPVLTATTTNPVLGSGSSVAGRYLRFGGYMCTYWGKIRFGTSGVSAGSGSYLVSLPFPAAASAVDITTGSAMLRDDNTGSITMGACYLGSGASTLSLLTTSIVSNAQPWAWAPNDYFYWNITYEIA
jgi:hypothetical protein